MTDEALMYEVTNDNTESASDLYERYSKRLYNYFVKITMDRELSSDLLQNTFLRMLKYRHSYHVGKSFEAWIFQIARNVYNDHLKKNYMLFDQHSDVYHLNEPDNSEANDISEREKRLQVALSRLSADSREILVLSRYQGLKYEQIGQILNITVPNVKVRVHRAIKKLRDHYLEIEKI